MGKEKVELGEPTYGVEFITYFGFVNKIPIFIKSFDRLTKKEQKELLIKQYRRMGYVD